MSYESGMAALNMEMTGTVPRTEYSADGHPELVKAVTGLPVGDDGKAQQAFLAAWDYAFRWSVPGGHEIPVKTDMGHAVFAAGGSDFHGAGECPFKTPEEALALDIPGTFENPSQAEINRICQERLDARRAQAPGFLATGGIYETLFSGLIHIYGWEMFMLAAGTDAERFGRIASDYAAWIAPWFEGYAHSDAEAVMSHDDICWTAGPVLAPAWYREFIFPHYKRLWQPVLDAGKKLMFTSDGTYDMFFDDIVECGAHSLVMEPGNDMAGFADKYGNTHGFVGNADTRILLTGSKEDIRNEVKRCMDIGRGCPGFIMAVGNHIPANTPVENALWYNECYNKTKKR